MLEFSVEGDPFLESPGRRLDSYEILSPLGAGGMGEVWRARDTALGREVAIKVLPAAYARDPDRLRRFEQEARAAGMLDYPNVLAIYAIGVAGRIAIPGDRFPIDEAHMYE
jgi:serine/threonine protein kinase